MLTVSFKHSQTKTGVYFQRTSFIAFAFSTFSLKWRIWSHQNATNATVCQLAFELPPTFEVVVLTFAHPVFIWGPFLNTWEKNKEWNHNTVTCHLLWTAEFDLFWREQANKSVLWSVSSWAFSPLLMLCCGFLCKAAVYVCGTVFVAAILHPLLYLFSLT